jgi:hypothetical protein
MDAAGMAESVTTPEKWAQAPATTDETGSAARLWGAGASTMALVAAKSATGALASAITDETGSAARL